MDDFDRVSWRHDNTSDSSRPTSSGTGIIDSFESHDINGKQPANPLTEEDDGTVHPPDLSTLGFGNGMDGVMECTVGSPLKENNGTKDAYISYLVTTHVCRSSLINRIWGANQPYRPISSRSSVPTFPCVDGSLISITYTERSIVNIQHAQSRHCQISSAWSMCGGIGSDPTLRKGGHGRCTAL